ncbi:MAG: hypothetical protein D6815_05345, partial [Candidatus Dadabacteria bacterium]
MPARRDELLELLARYREGAIDEQRLLERMRDLGVDLDEEPGSDDRRVWIDLLDRYRAAEASGAETLRRWAELTSDAALAGGLRAAAAREAAHAELLAQRIAELGGEPSATIPDWMASFNAALVDPGATDEERLGAVVAQFRDVDAALAPLREKIAGCSDRLTRALLEAMCEDEEVTLRWFHRACDKLRSNDS